MKPQFRIDVGCAGTYIVERRRPGLLSDRWEFKRSFETIQEARQWIEEHKSLPEYH